MYNCKDYKRYEPNISRQTRVVRHPIYALFDGMKRGFRKGGLPKEGGSDLFKPPNPRILADCYCGLILLILWLSL